MSRTALSHARSRTARLMTYMASAILGLLIGTWLILHLVFGIGLYSQYLASSDLHIEHVSISVPNAGLAADLFRSNDAAVDSLPGVVLVHGTSPAGRSLLLYQILARRIASRGAIVLLYDQRGYGDSPDPQVDTDGKHELPWVADAIQAAKFLREQPGVSSRDIRLLGHSFGASVAIGVSQVPGIACLLGRIVVLSPGRGLNQGDEDPFVFRAERLSSDMQLSSPLTRDDTRIMYASMEVEVLLASSEDVPAILLHTSDEEANRPLGPQVVKSDTSVAFKVISGTDHYFGTRRSFNESALPLKVYDAEPLAQLVTEIMAPVASRTYGCADNGSDSGNSLSQ